MSSLAAKAQIVKSRQQPPPCGVALLKSKLPPEDIAWLMEQMPNPNVRHSFIGEVLRTPEGDKPGYDIKDNTIGRHRIGKCSCGTV